MRFCCDDVTASSSFIVHFPSAPHAIARNAAIGQCGEEMVGGYGRELLDTDQMFATPAEIQETLHQLSHC
jgi:hypothetical protein